MSSSTPTDAPTNPLALDDVGEGKAFVKTLRDHPGICSWCLTPHRANVDVALGETRTTLRTAKTYDRYGDPAEEVPPDRVDSNGELVDVSRDEITICDCGRIDTGPQYSRSKDTTMDALDRLLSILDENDVDVTPVVARSMVNEAFERGHTGQFLETLGTAIHHATE